MHVPPLLGVIITMGPKSHRALVDAEHAISLFDLTVEIDHAGSINSREIL